MTRDEAIAACVAACPSLSRADVDGLLACSPAELEALVRAYQDAGKVSGPDPWAVVLKLLGACAELLPIVGQIAAAVRAVEDVVG